MKLISKIVGFILKSICFVIGIVIAFYLITMVTAWI